jgi:hypothetical protein
MPYGGWTLTPKIGIKNHALKSSLPTIFLFEKQKNLVFVDKESFLMP